MIDELINESNAKVEEGDFKLLDILHHFTSGMKSISTEMMYKGTDELRSSCGGAGFHVASGLVTGFTDHAPLSTFEGVNTLMSQQSARYVIKQVKKTKKGKKCKSYFEYINHLSQLISSKSTAKSIEECQSLDYLEHTLKVRSAFYLEMTTALLEESKEKDVVK